mmetsp:Transcript_12950/g.21565  ORF Transcript_12950/g.21565 Transcript_12950/m.21565 type:complete len:109 (+) Transcript_12950:372-698(+)
MGGHALARTCEAAPTNKNHRTMNNEQSTDAKPREQEPRERRARPRGRHARLRGSASTKTIARTHQHPVGVGKNSASKCLMTEEAKDNWGQADCPLIGGAACGVCQNFG